VKKELEEIYGGVNRKINKPEGDEDDPLAEENEI